MSKRTILITNDDGINSQGLWVLWEAFHKKWNTYIIAPDREQSASSHSVTLSRPLRISKIKNKVYSVDGTPSDCVHLAVNGFLRKKPDIVVAGINIGENLGDDITYSGTVAAAIEGTLLGIPSIAISLTGRKNLNFSPAVKLAEKVIQFILKNGLPQDILLNINVPNVKDEKEIKGIMATRKGKRFYNEHIIRRKDPRGKWYYWIGGDNIGNEVPLDNSDVLAIRQNYVSITPINVDLTDYTYLHKLKKEISGIW